MYDKRAELPVTADLCNRLSIVSFLLQVVKHTWSTLTEDVLQVESAIYSHAHLTSAEANWFNPHIKVPDSITQDIEQLNAE